MNDNKFKHLDYIHNTINRMSSNSFLIKGWTISIVSILFIFTDDKMNKQFLIITLLPIIIFWYLNGFFLQQERKYRALYDKVRLIDENNIDFAMSTNEFKGGRYSLLSNLFGKTIWPLYIVMIFMVLIVKHIVHNTCY
ncbi:hypothetical protein [Pontimicrobium sp. MEBiC06410]